MDSFKQFNRVLDIYDRLKKGEIITKEDAINRYCVSSKTIERDIKSINIYLEGKDKENVKFDKKLKGYVYKRDEVKEFSEIEKYCICKILLDSRAFKKEELNSLFDKILNYDYNSKRLESIKSSLFSEREHYKELCHKKFLIKQIDELNKVITEQKRIEIEYTNLKKERKKRVIYPLAIIFSEMYFYLIGKDYREKEDLKGNYLDYDFEELKCFRIDRIESFKVLDKFKIEYAKRFNEGDFKAKIHFMFGGGLKRYKFEYTGESIEFIMDKLPNVRILSQNKDKYLMTVETYGNGIEMWFKSQGSKIKILENI